MNSSKALRIGTPKRVVSLFSGIGGFELGFATAGFEPVLFCEIDGAAQAVLKAQWPAVNVVDDVRSLEVLPPCEIITAGFPCQDLSQAGRKAGIGGDQSGLVEHLFRLLSHPKCDPEYVIVENVPYMLGLDRGHAMAELVRNFERLGYSWAYRVVDARSFGVPQRRPRVLFLASRNGIPTAPLTGSGASELKDEKPAVIDPFATYGFYWTEGSRGLGWVRNGVPPIKGGSGLGIPSPPAIWFPKTGHLGKPTIRDAERLQGFPAGWTEPALSSAKGREGTRWKLVGNAVNVATARWLGERLASADAAPLDALQLEEFGEVNRWPTSAMGQKGTKVRLPLGLFPQSSGMTPIVDFLHDAPVPLSQKAALGFLKRALTTPKLVYSPQFIDSLHKYCGSGTAALLAELKMAS